MNRRTIVSSALLALAGLSASVHAQALPPLETGPKRVDVKMVDQQIEMRDAATGQLLMAPRGALLWDNKFDATGIKPDIQFQAQPAGFDLLYTFKNTASVAKPPAMIRLGILTLGSDITYHDFRYAGEEVQSNVVTAKAKALTYPKQLYSPVWVVKNNTHAMGISIQYPIMDYKHDVRYAFSSPGGKLATGEGGRGWLVEQRLANVGNETPNTELSHSASIAPGKSQSYVVSVRIADSDEWIRTLVPYRDFFQATYGPVKYQRDPRPIRAAAVASPPLITASNPMGFGDEKLRPDTNGWGPWVKRLKEPKGWAGVILWNPTGLYFENRDNNYPFNFTTHWLDHPKLVEAVDKVKGLPSVVKAGTPLGLWWGRSNQVAEMWDDPELESLNPENQAHRALAFAELDLAAEVGTTLIGLDTFSHRHTPVWKLYPWLQTLQDRHPQIRFTQEPICSDIMHTLAPTWFRTYNDAEKPESVAALMRAQSPHILADLVNPGHEIWAGFRYHGHKTYFGIEPTQAMIIEDAKRLAGYGFVPVLFTGFDMVPGIEAAESWKFTIPVDLQGGGSSPPPSGGGGGHHTGGDRRSEGGYVPPVGPILPSQLDAQQQDAAAPAAAKPAPTSTATSGRDTSSAQERARIASADD